METKLIKIMSESVKYPEEQALLTVAGDIIKAGGTVAFPTETVYGLGGNAFDSLAADKIYLAKGRPSDNPLIVHIADKEALERLTGQCSQKAEALMEAFWPGPMTLIFPKKEEVPDKVTGGLSTVAVRMPSNEVARSLIRAGGGYIAAPSANRSGGPSPTTARHVFEDLDGRVDMIIDGGESVCGLESTIVDMTVDPPMILRPGFITKEMLEEVIGEVAVDARILSEDSKRPPKAPGMKYRHYAPNADLTLFEGEPTRVAKEIWRRTKDELTEGKPVGIITTDEMLSYYRQWIREELAEDGEEQETAADPEDGRVEDLIEGLTIKTIGSRLEPETIAQHLYGVLRDFNETDVTEIFSESFSRDGVGQAIMNRLMKAAGQKIVRLKMVDDLVEIRRVTIVSTTDTCRGPLAAHLLRKHRFRRPLMIETRGLVAPFPEPVNQKMEAVAEGHHETLLSHRAHQLTEEDIRDDTLFFTMDLPMKIRMLKNYEGIRHIYSFDEFLELSDMEITSPYGGDLDAYEVCYEKTGKVIEKTAWKLNRLLS